PEDIDGFEDQDGCPEEDDTDGDGITDPNDKCPNVPEDMDLYLDEDGCPEPDNDEDTVLDMEDMCPLQPGLPSNAGCPSADRDGDTVEDAEDQCPDVPGNPPSGCPKRVLVEVKDSHIEIKEKINFELNGSSIKGGISFQILDQISQVLKSNPQLKIKIEGHTDSSGAADYNLQLSDSRAKAVAEALVKRGIDSGRLQAIGYGESRPIASNSSKSGRATNRRVEFNIVKK
ncbi:MAG: OmpA family protein, partial [Myxococcota bacterium]|nr:OmpA family protein [Myxococcota bacterium]